LTLDLTYFCVFWAFFFWKFWRWRIRIPAIIIFIVAEEEISGKCQNKKTYLNCSFKRKYQTNTKTGRSIFKTSEEFFYLKKSSRIKIFRQKIDIQNQRENGI
jgi:hypothetical protein